MRGTLRLALPLLAVLADPGAALREGNHLFRGGDLEAALAAYADGWDGADPILAYNLGTTAHQLGRLPEALLWYRRAERRLAGDPWLRDNLRLVRAQLRAEGRTVKQQGLGGLGGWTFWMESRPYLTALGVALAWGTLLLVLLPLPRALRRRTVAPAALLSCLAFGAGALLPRFGPRPAVLLEDCTGPAGPLPSGSEVWVAPSAVSAGKGGWRVLGSEGTVRCPTGGIGLVDL
jgi:hypothetical protein